MSEEFDPLRSFVNMHDDPELIAELDKHLDFARANEVEDTQEYNILVASSIIKDLGIERAALVIERGQEALKMLLAQIIIEFFAVLQPNEIIECLVHLMGDIRDFEENPESRPDGLSRAMQVADAFRTALDMAEVEAGVE